MQVVSGRSAGHLVFFSQDYFELSYVSSCTKVRLITIRISPICTMSCNQKTQDSY